MPATDVYRALWRHRLMIVLLTVVAGVAAYALTTQQATIYQSTALIRIQQTGATPGDTFGAVSSLELGQRLAQTYAKIVTTRSMKNRVITNLGGLVTRDEFSIRAAPVADVDLLQISARNENARTAALVANATTAALKEFITETGTLRDQIVVVDRATAPDSPAAPRTKLTVAIAVMLALLFNAALALVREFFADRLPGIDEFEDKLGRPVLATVPNLAFRTPGAPVTVAPPPTPAQPVAAAAAAGRGAWPGRGSLPAPSETSSRRAR